MLPQFAVIAMAPQKLPLDANSTKLRNTIIPVYLNIMKILVYASPPIKYEMTWKPFKSPNISMPKIGRHPLNLTMIDQYILVEPQLIRDFILNRFE